LDRVVTYYLNKFGILSPDAHIEIIGRASRRRNDHRRHLNSDLAARRAIAVDRYLDSAAFNAGAKLARRIVDDDADDESVASPDELPNFGRERAVDVNMYAGTAKVPTRPPLPGHGKFNIILHGGIVFGARALTAAGVEVFAVFTITEIADAIDDDKSMVTDTRYIFACPFGLGVAPAGPKDILNLIAKNWGKLVKPVLAKFGRSPPFSFQTSRRIFGTDFKGSTEFEITPGPSKYKLHMNKVHGGVAFTNPPPSPRS
jgi:hypothetical protein